MNQRIAFCLLLFIYTSQLAAQKNEPVIVQAGQPAAVVQPTMYGIFFEDINFAADGGIYAELVKNRSFEFDIPLMGWKTQQEKSNDLAVQVLNRADQPANPRYARCIIRKAGNTGLSNEGFRGIGYKENDGYDFSVWARSETGDACKVVITLRDEQQQSIGTASIVISGKDWKKYTAVVKAGKTVAKGSIHLGFPDTGIIDMDMVSLFPQDTWKKRPGGLRKDLVQKLADLHPGFLRFPGGCIVEGRDLDNRYQWKKTVGPVEDRELIINRWNTEFRHKPAPDYFQSFGLGFYEYFLLAEDIGASPLPILNCGMACQFNTAELVPLDQLDPYIQDALDLIEFANGPVTSKWGQLRASMGHPEPFNLKMLGVGNEQWGEQYVERYKIFEKVLKDKYPDIKIVSSVGPFPDGELFDYLDPLIRGSKADLIDEHYYRPPEWFLKNVTRYDAYDRNGPKIFAGEYAAHSRSIASNDNVNNWLCALSEAAFITGLERNADVVHMTSYAPLFAHADGWQWTPDLIWFDNLRSYGTPNYYVQQLFSLNKGTHIVPALMSNEAITGQDSLFVSASIDEGKKEVMVKIVNVSAATKPKTIQVNGKKLEKTGQLTVLSSQDRSAVNSLSDPEHIYPVESELNSVKSRQVNLELAPYSVTVLKFGYK